MLEKIQNILVLHASICSKCINMKLHHKMFRNKVREQQTQRMICSHAICASALNIHGSLLMSSTLFTL